MQRPRRTSEFHEEPGTATKRNSRPQQRLTWAPSPAPNTANRYNTRQSRIARPSSSDRQTLGIPLNSALRGTRITPQKTPTPRKTPTMRVLFTAEKERNAHNDKRWVQEKAQQIVEHLRETAKPGAVHGLPAEFFARSGCLRQMSTKQFVAIINHFLHYIWGSRFTVGANHVDDIINILQKLQYPHQVNKSWLKTPNTQHSFGYVIQLFDYLMDFVPPQNEAQQQDMQFGFQEPQELSQSVSEDQLLQVPDCEFQALMLCHSEEGFSLWDKDMRKDFNKLQRQTCDALIMKRCGITSVDALEAELAQLAHKLGEVQKQRPHIRKEDETLCDKLENELKELQQQLQVAHDDLDAITEQSKQLEKDHQFGKNEVGRLEKEVQQLQTVVQQQSLSAKQRDELIEEMSQLKYTLQSQERTCRELQDRLHHEQVVLSRNKKKLTDQISKYNGHIREITYALLLSNTEDLQLPLNPQQNDLQIRISILKQLHTQTQNKLQQALAEQQLLEQQVSELTHIITSNVEPKCNELTATLKAVEKNATQFEQQAHEQRSTMDAQLRELEERMQSLRLQVKHFQNLKTQKERDLKNLCAENEQVMKNAEDEYNTHANEREEFLNQYEKTLEKANVGLLELDELIKNGESQLQQLKTAEEHAHDAKCSN